KRQYFVGPAAFEYDGIAILGVAVGLQTVSALERANYNSWLASIAEKSLQTYNCRFRFYPAGYSDAKPDAITI
ncbi:MAG: hypothetical protein WCF79_21990, partial [Rhodomicrobium sp.]